jgi:hypothetical protein
MCGTLPGAVWHSRTITAAHLDFLARRLPTTTISGFRPQDDFLPTARTPWFPLGGTPGLSPQHTSISWLRGLPTTTISSHRRAGWFPPPHCRDNIPSSHQWAWKFDPLTVAVLTRRLPTTTRDPHNNFLARGWGGTPGLSLQWQSRMATNKTGWYPLPPTIISYSLCMWLSNEHNWSWKFDPLHSGSLRVPLHMATGYRNDAHHIHQWAWKWVLVRIKFDPLHSVSLGLPVHVPPK